MSRQPHSSQRVSILRALTLHLALHVLLHLALHASPVRAQDATVEEFVPLTCVSCAAGQYLDQETLNCTACPAGSSTFEYTNASRALDCLCEPGFENASTVCTQCALGLYKEVLQNTTCLECPPNSFTNDTGSSSIAACLCNAGYFPEDTANSDIHFQLCEPCAAGTYKAVLADAVCDVCPENHYCPEAAVTPLACPPDSSSGPASQRVTDCLCHPGFHMAFDSTDFTASGGYHCQPCAAGTFNELVNQTACTLCPANTFNPLEASPSVQNCSACDTAASSDAGSTSVEHCTCNLGYAGEPGDACVACEPGTYRENSSSYICESCPLDTYNVDYASDSDAACTACPASTSALTGSRSQLACVCDPGFFYTLQPATADTAAFFACTPCAAGSYAEAKNTSSCDLCAAGKFSTSVGATTEATCSLCDDGYYAISTGVTACDACGFSTWQDQSTGDYRTRECSACPLNSSHAVAASVDINDCICADGLYKNVFGSDSFECATCLAGFQCPSLGSILECPVNHWSYAGITTACTPCAQNSQAVTDQAVLTGPHMCQCVAGAQGTYHTNCSLCPAGKFQPLDLTYSNTSFNALHASEAQPTVCQPCFEGYYMPASGYAECVQCPRNSSSPAGSDRLAACVCNNGFYGHPGSDEWFPDSQCLVCPQNYFCSAGNQYSCRANSLAPPGSDAQSDCLCRAQYYSDNSTSTCLKCPTGFYCPGGQLKLTCATNSSSHPGSDTQTQCSCQPGTWRGCIYSSTLNQTLNATGAPCTIDWSLPCVQCGPNDICFNDTLLHCPEHATAEAGSYEDQHCVCDDGFYAEYAPEHTH